MNTAYQFLKSYIPVRNALKTREDGDFLVASSSTNEIYYFNGMAKDMWSMLDGITSIEELCVRILGEYNVERSILERDIVEFIRNLQWKKLIRIRRQPT